MLLYRIHRRAQKSLEWLRGWIRARFALPFHAMCSIPIRDLTYFQRRIPFIERHEYSQNGEDGIIEAIFAMIGTDTHYGVEFGVEDGRECNMRYLLKKKGWRGLLMDGRDNPPETGVKKEFITAENIEELFAKHVVPTEFDLLSIDIDGNDYWVWKAIKSYRPRVVIMEYNAHIPPEVSKTIPYQADFRWDKTDYYGASLAALKKLGDDKGYTLVCTDKHGVNAFFIKNELIAGKFDPPPWPKTYNPPAFKGKKGQGHPPDTQNRPWVTV